MSDQPTALMIPSPRMPTRRKFWLPPRSSLNVEGALALAAFRSARRLILIIGSVPHLSESQPHRDGGGRGHVVQDVGGDLASARLDAPEGVQDLDLGVEALTQRVLEMDDLRGAPRQVESIEGLVGRRDLLEEVEGLLDLGPHV